MSGVGTLVDPASGVVGVKGNCGSTGRGSGVRSTRVWGMNCGVSGAGLGVGTVWGSGIWTSMLRATDCAARSW
jgi:hypothetical protein